MNRIVSFTLLLTMCLTGCSPAIEEAAAAPTTPWTPTPLPSATWTATSTATSTATPYATPDLSPRPLVWFAPLPPLPTHSGRPFTGSTDFMSLFAENAPWEEAAGRVQVFKLYGEWVAYHATDAELRQVVSDLNRRGVAIAFEAGPLTPTEACGSGIEGFAGVEEGLLIARRIQNAGGTVRFVAFDHPYDAGVLDTSSNACHWSAEEVARNAARFITAIRGVFPEVVFGDIETVGHDVDEIAQWVNAYKDIVGEDLGFLHMDLNYSQPDWPQGTKEIETFLRTRGIEFGIIYFGGWNDRSDEVWLSNAGERVKAYEMAAGGQPDHVVFQSWHDHPDLTLPETDPYTFTWFVNTYFNNPSALGFRTEGPGANLAFGKSVKASRDMPGFEVRMAVDGNFDTWWGSGDFAPQWIEIDLGSPQAIAEINLLVTQSPAGETRHEVFVRGPETGDAYVLVYTFAGTTADMDLLSVPIADPLEAIRYIRVTTQSSPSWVGWREVEVIASR